MSIVESVIISAMNCMDEIQIMSYYVSFLVHHLSCHEINILFENSKDTEDTEECYDCTDLDIFSSVVPLHRTGTITDVTILPRSIGGFSIFL